mmetsp:Transcript_26094/g.42638  ORF Transcript_26094/g.42638 Transcript_26094/m.42638 type:complete len:400 (+) Transcript_26094:57-1256(+)
MEQTNLLNVAAAQAQPSSEDASLIYVDGKVKNVCNIDVVHETFRVKMHVYLTWKLPKADREKYDQYEANSDQSQLFEPSFIPSLEIFNLNEMVREPCFGKFNVRKEKDYGCRVKLEFNAICNEEYELQSFPFDVQDLAVDLRLNDTDYSLRAFDLKSDENAFFSILPSPLFDAEYTFRKCLVEFFRSAGKKSRGGKTYSHCVLRLKLERNSEYYVLNYLLIIALITLCAFTSFGFYGVSETTLGDRLSVLITLILASVAQRLLVTSALPNLQYLTLLDWYSLSSFMFLVLLTVFTSVFCYVAASSEANEENDFVHWNSFFFVTAMAIWLIGNVFFVSTSIKAKQKERRKLDLNTEQLRSEFEIQHHRSVINVKPNSKARAKSQIYSDMSFYQSVPADSA